MSLSPGDKLGPYEIFEPIGKGGMGEVYRARDTRLGRDVAIKISTKQFNERFEREARAISSLNHPNICTLHDIGSSPQVPGYLVMEFVEGETLSQILSRGPLPLDKALQYAGQITDALAAAHAKGIIHRDLKPGNIMITPHGVKVLDFGLAKLAQIGPLSTAGSSEVATMTEPITGAGSIVGTLHYMSPEQVESKDVDERSDIFAFGAVLYEMITGQRAFDGDTKAAIMAAVMKDQPASIRQLRPEAPRALDRIVRKCLEKKPEDRWQTAKDLKPTLELVDLEAPSSGSMSGTTPISSSGSGIHPAAQQRNWMLPAVSLIAILALGGLGWALWPTEQTATQVTRFTGELPDGITIDASTFYIVASPDGTKVAFTSAGLGGGIWVRDLESLEARLLPETVGAVSPFWSPDSRSIGFSRNLPGDFKMMRVDLDGGVPQVLVDSPTAVGSGVWTDAGEIIFGGRPRGPIRKVPEGGGVPTPVTTLAEGQVGQALPSMLPDGRHFLFLGFGQSASGVERNLFVASLDAGTDQTLQLVGPSEFGATFVQSGNSDEGHLFYLRDGNLMAQPFDTSRYELTGTPVVVARQVGNGPSHGHFSVTPAGLLAYRSGAGEGTQMTWLDREGRDQEVVGEPSTTSGNFSLSPDETRVAIARENESGRGGDLWLLDLNRQVETRFTFENTAVNAPPVWSPDGQYVAYLSGALSQPRLTAKLANGAEDGRVLWEGERGEPYFVPTDWSENARFLILMGGDPQGIYALAMQQGESVGEPFLLLPDAAAGTLSPDGRWLAYRSEESGRREVYIRPFQADGASAAVAGAKWQISRNGGGTTYWRDDSNELLFVWGNPEGLEVYSTEIQADGDALLPGSPVRLFTVPGNASGGTVTKDAQRFLISMPLDRGSQTPITIVLNWQAALEQ